MSFNIKNSFVSRAIVEADKQVDAEENKESDEGVQNQRIMGKGKEKEKGY